MTALSGLELADEAVAVEDEDAAGYEDTGEGWVAHDVPYPFRLQLENGFDVSHFSTTHLLGAFPQMDNGASSSTTHGTGLRSPPPTGGASRSEVHPAGRKGLGV